MPIILDTRNKFKYISSLEYMILISSFSNTLVISCCLTIKIHQKMNENYLFIKFKLRVLGKMTCHKILLKK